MVYLIKPRPKHPNEEVERIIEMKLGGMRNKDISLKINKPVSFVNRVTILHDFNRIFIEYTGRSLKSYILWYRSGCMANEEKLRRKRKSALNYWYKNQRRKHDFPTAEQFNKSFEVYKNIMESKHDKN